MEARKGHTIFFLMCYIAINWLYEITDNKLIIPIKQNSNLL